MGVRATPELEILHSFPIKADSLVAQDPDIAFDGGNFMVVWSEGGFPGEHKVKAARVTTEGVVLDSGTLFGMGAYMEYKPVIDFDGDRYLTVWYNYNGVPYGVFGRFINTQCEPEGREFAIRLSDISYAFEPDIAFGNESYLVVWQELSLQYDDSVYGQIVSMTGELIGDVIPIATTSEYQSYPRIGTGTLHYLVVWEQESKIYGQWVSMSGELIGKNFAISDSCYYNRGNPDIAFGSNNCLCTWKEYHTDNNDIYGNLDILMQIKEEQVKPVKNYHGVSTIINGLLILPDDKKCRVYDITGREVVPNKVSPGIYFIEIDGTIKQKVVKVR